MTGPGYDAVVIGSGAGGGAVAMALCQQKQRVLVLEAGPSYDPLSDYRLAMNTWEQEGFPYKAKSEGRQTFAPLQPLEKHWEDLRSWNRAKGKTNKGDRRKLHPHGYSHVRGVGGSTLHFSGEAHRLHPQAMQMRSRFGVAADWPFDYAELEPYYTRVDWEIGLSGAPGPDDSFRSRPFPVPPFPIKSSGLLMEKGARAMGFSVQPEPHAILSQPLNGRPACINCGFCMGYGCEANAKSSTLAAMVPAAIDSGHCEIRPECAVYEITTNASGRVSEVAYIDPEVNQSAQKAREVVLSANGDETQRLLLNWANSLFPDGLANSSGFVGRNLMYNSHSFVRMVFERQLNDFKGVQVSRIIHHFYDSDPQRGFYGGGGIDARPWTAATPLEFAVNVTRPDGPTWGAQYKAHLEHDFSRTMYLVCSGTSLAQDRNNITIDPTHKDAWGRPSLRLTYRDHDDDMALVTFLQDRALEVADAAGAMHTWPNPIHHQNNGAHLLGTCRMGDDPATSVVDRFHRSHDIPNLFICDGSSFVTSGRGQPTMTIMALAFRAAEHMMAAARANEI